MPGRASMDEHRPAATFQRPRIEGSCARKVRVQAGSCGRLVSVLLRETIATIAPRREVATSGQPGRHGSRAVDGVNGDFTDGSHSGYCTWL